MTYLPTVDCSFFSHGILKNTKEKQKVFKSKFRHSTHRYMRLFLFQWLILCERHIFYFFWLYLYLTLYIFKLGRCNSQFYMLIHNTSCMLSPKIKPNGILSPNFFPGKFLILDLKYIYMHMYKGFVGGSVVRKSTCNAEDVDLITEGFNPWIWKIPWRRKWQSTSTFLPGKSHNKGAWWATVYGVTEESDMT